MQTVVIATLLEMPLAEQPTTQRRALHLGMLQVSLKCLTICSRPDPH